eukprot:scaffold21698_cov50-Skeletonema_dohrnii-CCMP3373.AAC.1
MAAVSRGLIASLNSERCRAGVNKSQINVNNALHAASFGRLPWQTSHSPVHLHFHDYFHVI